MSKKLSKADAFYIESHYGKMDAKALAGDLGLHVKTVNAYLKKLTDAGFSNAPPEPAKPPKKKTLAERAGYSVKGESVSATEASSVIGDESLKRPNVTPALKNCAYIMRPEENAG